MHAASWWTTSQLGFSTTTVDMEFHTQLSSQWKCTPAYGTPTTGQRKAAEWRPTGPRLLSSSLTGTTTPSAVSSLVPAIPVTEIWTASRGKLRDWMQPAEIESDGSKIITWSTTTVMMAKGFRWGALRNVGFPGFRVWEFFHGSMHAQSNLFSWKIRPNAWWLCELFDLFNRNFNCWFHLICCFERMRRVQYIWFYFVVVKFFTCT